LRILFFRVLLPAIDDPPIRAFEPQRHVFSPTVAVVDFICPVRFFGVKYDGQPVATTTILKGSMYGYGLFITDLDGHVRIGHTGTGSGFQSMIMTYPNGGYTVVVLMNGADGPSSFIAGALEESLAKLLLGVSH
jgi:hypothetical protein